MRTIYIEDIKIKYNLIICVEQYLCQVTSAAGNLDGSWVTKRSLPARFSCEERDQTSSRIKTKTCQQIDDASCRFSSHLEQQGKLGSIAIDVAIAGYLLAVVNLEREDICRLYIPRIRYAYLFGQVYSWEAAFRPQMMMMYGANRKKVIQKFQGAQGQRNIHV